MSLVPAFELGLWNAWVFEALSITIWVPAYLIDKEALKRYFITKRHHSYREYMDRTPRWIGIPKSKKND